MSSSTPSSATTHAALVGAASSAVVLVAAGLGMWMFAPQQGQRQTPTANPSATPASKVSRRISFHGDADDGSDDEGAGQLLSPQLLRQATERTLQEQFETLQSQVATLQAENKRLMRLLTLSEAQEASPERFVAGLPVLTPSEVETMRAIFDIFDTNQNGAIYVTDIQALHKRLGEPLSDEEAAEVMRDIDLQKRGEVSFDDFVHWWSKNRRGKGDPTKYQERFKLIRAKLSPEDFDLDRLVTKPVGEEGTTEFRVMFFYKKGSGQLKPISPWHDIPLAALGQGKDARVFHFVCEIPKWTRAKYEIATGEPYNPIKQDTKNGKLRFYRHGDMMFNYGAFPRTWEDPDHTPEETGFRGDNDPIDAIEIGTRQLATGEVTPVKILGVLALIDSGETDFKVLCIAVNDPLANQMHDIDDVDKVMPGAVDSIRHYLRVYKVATGAPENTYALRGQAMPRDYALSVIDECHKHWVALSERNQTTV